MLRGEGCGAGRYPLLAASCLRADRRPWFCGASGLGVRGAGLVEQGFEEFAEVCGGEADRGVGGAVVEA